MYTGPKRGIIKYVNVVLEAANEEERMKNYSVLSLKMAALKLWFENNFELLPKYNVQQTKIVMDLLKNICLGD